MPQRISIPSGHELLHPLAPRIDDVHSAIFRDRNVVREPELPVVIAEAAKSRDQSPIGIHDGDTGTVRRYLWLIAPVRDEHTILPPDCRIGPAELDTLPLVEELAGLIEHLDS